MIREQHADTKVRHPGDGQPPTAGQRGARPAEATIAPGISHRPSSLRSRRPPLASEGVGRSLLSDGRLAHFSAHVKHYLAMSYHKCEGRDFTALIRASEHQPSKAQASSCDTPLSMVQ